MSNYYVGLDAHKASICVAVLNADGKSVMESVVETSAATILDFLKGLRGQVEVTFEEGTHAAWLYDVLKRTKTKVIVCDPRKNRLLNDGSKSDKVDARKLAQLLRAGLLSPVYHGEHGVRDLKELVRSYEYLVEDSTRVMNRIKALYRSRAIACSGTDVYKQQQRDAWLEKLPEAGVRARAARLYSEPDHLTGLRREARLAMPSREPPPRGKQDTSSSPDTRHRAYCAVDRRCRDAAPLSQQTAVLVVLRAGGQNALERRSSFRQRRGTTDGESGNARSDAGL